MVDEPGLEAGGIHADMKFRLYLYHTISASAIKEIKEEGKELIQLIVEDGLKCFQDFSKRKFLSKEDQMAVGIGAEG